MPKRFPCPKTLPEVDQILLENEVLGHYKGKISHRTFASAFGEYALLFSTDIPVDFIGKIKDVNCDATFETVPSCFYQLLIIPGVILDTIVPLFYNLMTGKSRTFSDAISVQLLCLVSSFQPKLSVTDFEHALFGSIKFSFQCDVQGCFFFHFRQSLWRKWQQLGLSTIKERQINVQLRLLMTLPLFPFHEISPACYALAPSTQDFHVSDNMKSFYQYLKRENHDSEIEEIDVSPDEFKFDLDCDETELTGFTFCSFCEIRKIEFCAIPCGHVLYNLHGSTELPQVWSFDKFTFCNFFQCLMVICVGCPRFWNKFWSQLFFF